MCHVSAEYVNFMSRVSKCLSSVCQQRAESVKFVSRVSSVCRGVKWLLIASIECRVCQELV